MSLARATGQEPKRDAPPLPSSLKANPRLGQWLRIRPEGHVEVRSGKVEIGQGILTALAQIVADTLGLRLDQVRMIAADTAASPNEAVTSGSLSIQESGAALRHVCAEARAIYLDAAARRLGVGAERLIVAAGGIHAPAARSTSYWALADDRLLDRDAAPCPTPAAAALVGTSASRLDLPDKVFGVPRFIHDLALPGMLHGRILRPPSPAATLVAADEAATLACDGVVSVPRDGSLLGLLADTERHAERGLAVLRRRAVWREAEALPDADDLTAWLKAQAVERTVVAERTARDDPGRHRSGIVRCLKASYAKPFLAHASIAPSCALARFDGTTLEVWTHSQGIFNLRRDLALAFAMAPERIVVRHVEGAGCYGHNPADDAAFDAAWLARAAPGRPVKVIWSRADELASTPFGPAMAVDIEADLDANGAVVAWRQTVWSNGHSTRPGRASSPALLGSWAMEPPFARLPAINAPLAAGGGADRNAIPSYDFPAWHVVSNRVLAMPLRTSAMRSLGALANVFAAECFMDELAAAVGCDPVRFRLRHTTDPRARRVIAMAAEMAGWERFRPAEGRGVGLGFARYKNTGAYCAVVTEIRAGRDIAVERLTIAVDVGLAINPDGVVNQIEGGAIQATSWTLKEAVRFDRTRITSDSWDDYPILRFPEIPAVDVHVVASSEPSVGAGEGSVGPTAGAIANAVCNALGLRIRQLPLTAERIVAAFDVVG